MYETNLDIIATHAEQREEENRAFLGWVHQAGLQGLDGLVHHLYEEATKQVDCTGCGNCCKTLMINVTPAEAEGLAATLSLPVAQVKEQYIEESLQGNMFINTMPCHFLADNKCTIYAGRFTECRDFPHLHKPGFKERLLGTLGHYGRCPLIYNVVEQVKQAVGFFELATPGGSIST